eukprot:7533867-Pyramimonas_sp.AAC.1
MRPPCESDWHETRAVQAQPDTLGAADTTQAAPAGRAGRAKAEARRGHTSSATRPGAAYNVRKSWGEEVM